MTALGCSLKPEIFITTEVYKALDTFFSEGTAVRGLKRISSESGDDVGVSNDAEQRADVEEWDSFNPDGQDSTEDSVLDDEVLGWSKLADLFAYGNMDSLLLIDSKKFVVLTRPPNDYDKLSITLSCSPQFRGFDEEDDLSCGTLFAIGSTRKSEVIDCMCVAVGTTNGLVAFFTEKGILLFVERFSSTASILDIRVDQFQGFQHFMVVTESEIFSVNPFVLLSVLSQAKAAIARGDQNVDELSDTLELEVERLEPEGRPSIGAVLATGIVKPSSFDQYVAASAESYNRKMERAAMPDYSSYFLTSPSEFAQFVWHESGEGAGIWTEAFSKVAKKIPIPHFGFRKWLGFAQDDTKKTWALGAKKLIGYNRNVWREHRQAEYLVRAPDRPLIAVVDNHARVILFDYQSRQVVRLWKGYRECRCAFVTASEGGKTALFLVLLAPRRGLLEIWTVPNGVRVGARHVPPQSLLIDASCDAVLGSSTNNSIVPTASAFLLTPDNVIQRIVVPFHVALATTNSHDEHDTMLLNMINNPGAEFAVEDFTSTFSQLKTIRGRRQAVLSVISQLRTPVILRNFVEALRKVETAQYVNELLTQLTALCTVFELMSDRSRDNVDVDMDLEAQLPMDHLMEDTRRLVLRHIDMRSSSEEFPVEWDLSDFLGFVDFQSSRTSLFSRNSADVDLLRLGNLVFGGLLNSPFEETRFRKVADLLPFEEEDLVRLLCFVWGRTSSRPSARQVLSLYSLVCYYANENGNYQAMFQKTYAESENLDRALCLCSILLKIRCYRKRVEERGEADDQDDEEFRDADEGNGEASGWEEVDTEKEATHCTLQAIHTLSLLSQVDPSVRRQSYVKLAQGGKGYLREQLAKYVVAMKRERTSLFEVMYGTDEETARKGEDEGSSKDTPDEENPDESRTKTPLRELSDLLPQTLSADRLSADCVWELLSHWVRHREEEWPIELLSGYMEGIECDRIRHGLCRLMWDTHLAEPFKALAELVDKTGRGPKDREARQILDVGQMSVPVFLQLCLSVLSWLRDSVRESPAPIIIETEEWIELAFSRVPSFVHHSASNRDSLLESTIRQPLANYHLVLHHIHLVIVMLLQLNAENRCHVLRVLFDAAGQRAFFLPLTSHPLIPLERVDEEIVARRETWIEGVTKECGEEDRKRARILCTEWNIQMDSIAITIITLLRENDDETAGRELAPIQDNLVLRKQLLSILAARVLQACVSRDVVLSQKQEIFLSNLAGDELTLIELPFGEEEQSIKSLGSIIAGLPMQSSSNKTLQQLDNLCAQSLNFRFN